MNNMEVVGKVISNNPTKLSLVNKMDDAELFRSDVTYDAKKKFAEISASSNSSEFHLSCTAP